MKPILALIAICVLIFIAGLNGRARSAWPQQLGKLDEFGDVTCEDELARLDRLALEAQKTPNSQVHIIVYAGRRGRRNEALARAARMKFYLVRNRGLPRNRIVTLDGGYRENLTIELWLVSSGDTRPLPTPTLRPSDVIIKGRVRIRGYYCGAGLG